MANNLPSGEAWMTDTRKRLALFKSMMDWIRISKNVWRVNRHLIYHRGRDNYDVRMPMEDRERFNMKPYRCKTLTEAFAFVAYNSAIPSDLIPRRPEA